MPVALRNLVVAAVVEVNEAVTITVADLDDPRIVFVNPAFTALTGYSADEVLGKTPRMLQGPKTDRGVLDRLRAELGAGLCFAGETVNYRKDGSAFWLEWRVAPMRDADGQVTHFVAAQRDVTARVQSQEAAQRSNLAKTQFLGRMSHELLTPLNSMIGFPEMLIDGHFGPLNMRQRQAVSNVHEASEQLRRLIHDLLDLARIEAGRLKLESSVFHLGALMADLTASVGEAARRKDLDLSVVVEEPLPLLTGDPVRLKRLILNLLDNAIKYTPAGGWVKVRAWHILAAAGPPLLRIAVADSGMGIRAEDRERIFLLFEQVDPSLTRGQPGTGLGLALVRRILDLHGGRVWVESAGLGTGSTFHIEIPASSEEPS
jgi:PAS domain S-box-containing protein